MTILDPFRCEVGYRPDCWVIAPSGELDLTAAPEVRAAVRVVRSRPAGVTLDLRGLTFMDSSGIKLVLELLRTAHDDGYDLVVVKGSKPVQRTLAVAGVEPALNLVEAPPPTSDAEDRPPHAVIATDLAGTVTHWNAEAELAYGWRADEVIGRPITELTVGPEDRQLAEEIMDSVRLTGEWTGDFEVRRKDGSSFEAHVRNTLIRDEHGEAVGLAGVSIASHLMSARL